MRRDHLALLDGVRFACAAAVLAYHLLAVFPLAASSVTLDIDPGRVLPAALARYTWWGWVGVDLFFVVSGYVIAASAARVGAEQFVRRRALRLLPAAWLCATLTAVVLLWGSTMPVAEVLTRWATSMALFPLGQPIDEIYWTLGVEVAFYAIVAALLRRDADNRPRLTALGVGLAAASLAFWVGQRTGWLAVEPQSTPVRLLLLPHGGFFAAGIALRALAERPNRWASWLTLGVGLAAGACEIVAFTATMTGVAGFTADPAVPVTIFATGVAAIALAPRLRGRAAHPGWALLGATTYPLYLLNQRFAAGVLIALIDLGLPVSWALAGTAGSVVLLASAIAYWAEPRVRRWLGARLSPPRALAPDIRPTASPLAG